MAEYTKTLAADTSASGVYVMDIVRRRAADFFVASILAYGGFGGGTLTFYISPDKGTTLVPLTSSPGDSAISLTTAGMALVNFGNPSSNTTSLQLWIKLTGSTSPTLTVAVYDNR